MVGQCFRTLLAGIGANLARDLALGGLLCSPSWDVFPMARCRLVVEDCQFLVSPGSHLLPIYYEDSLTTTDSNLDGPSYQIIDDEISQWTSALYDITVEISIHLPQDEIFNKPDMLRAAVYTICGDIFFKHKEWRCSGARIAYHMGRSLNPTSSIWTPVKNAGLMYRGRTKICGHIMGLPEFVNPPIVYDTLSFGNYICATNVRMDYTTELFLTPAVCGADKIYKKHGFSSDIYTFCYKKKHMEDVLTSQETEGFKNYDHHLAWASVYNVLAKYRLNVAKQNLFLEEYGFSF